MLTGIASIPKALNVFKARYPQFKNLKDIKLSNKNKRFIGRTEYKIKPRNQFGQPLEERTVVSKREIHLPKKDFVDDFEKIRKGELNRGEAAKKHGMVEIRNEEGRTGIYPIPSFRLLYDSYLKNVPDDLFTKGGKPREWSVPSSKAGKDKQFVKPIFVKKVNDAIELADKSDSKIPYNLRFFEAYKNISGRQGQGTKQFTGEWMSVLSLAPKLFKFKKRKIPDLRLPNTLRYDVKRNVVDIANPGNWINRRVAFKNLKVGDIATGKSLQYAREVEDSGGKWPTVLQRIYANPKVKRYIDPIVAALPKNKFGDPINTLYHVDHVVPPRFGGTNAESNLRFIVAGQHTGPRLTAEMTPVRQVVQAKSSFEKDAFNLYTGMIDNVVAGNIKEADILKKQLNILQKNFKKTNPNVDFGIGEPYVMIKTGDLSATHKKYIDQLKLKPKIKKLLYDKYIKSYSNRPNKKESIEDSAKKLYERMLYFMNLYGGKLPKGLGRELGEFKEGGLINGDLTDTIAPERGPMPEGLPLLDPLESIDRSRRQHFQVGGFANLFGKLGRVPKAVGRFGDIKKPSLAKPKATTEVVVGQAVEDKPAMFLSTVNAIEDMPDAANMNAQQWLGTIRNKPGVSATELDEFGLEALLTNMHKANPKQKLTKAQLIENYNREMPKIDMDIAIAEPVSRGGKDLAKMLLDVREKRGPSHYDDQVDIFSNDARLLTDLHQPPQDRVGFVLRGKLIDIMKGTTKVAPRADQEDQIIKLLEPTGRQAYHFQTRDSVFKELWEKAFPNLFHTTNNIVKQGYRDELATLVPSQDVTKLSIAKNISEEQAFEELYQALNIFDRQVMTADVPIPFWTKKLLYRLGDMSEGRGFFYKSKRTPAHEGAQFIPGGSGYGELKFYQNFDTGAVRAKEADYRSGHFSGEVFQGNTGNSPFGWLRFSERIDESGRKILMAEEIQSDLHQAVAQKGYNYAPRLDKHDVLAEMGEFAKQLDTKKQTLESTRLRKDAIKALPRVERESEANVAELKNIEKAIKKLIGDVKKLQKKVEAQAKATGRSGQVHPDTAFKKSENYAKLFMQGLMKMANDKGYDGVALSTGKMKKAHGAIPKGGDKFYDEIGVKAMKRMAKKSGFNFTDTTIVDGNGFTWEKIPLIEMRDINTGIKIPGEATIPVYKKGGIVNKKMVKK